MTTAYLEEACGIRVALLQVEKLRHAAAELEHLATMLKFNAKLLACADRTLSSARCGNGISKVSLHLALACILLLFFHCKRNRWGQVHQRSRRQLC